MFKLITHHTYKLQGEAVDISRSGNHGFRTQTSYEPHGISGTSGLLRFDQANSQVRVPNTAIWKNLKAVRIELLAFVTEPTAGPRRLNLVEGELSFAFFINADRTLWGTFLGAPTPGASPTWHGANSANDTTDGIPRLVPFNQWVKLTYEHDGISTLRLYINDQLVAANYQLVSPIDSVKNNGVFIGHWVGDDRYTFVGKIDDVKIWKYDPESLYKQFFCRPMSTEQMLCWKHIFDTMKELLKDKKEREEFIQLMKCIRQAQLELMREIRSHGEEGIKLGNEYRKRYQSLWCKGIIDGPEMASLYNDWGTAVVELVGTDSFNNYKKHVQHCWEEHESVARVFKKVTGKLIECDPTFAGYINLLKEFEPKTIPRKHSYSHFPIRTKGRLSRLKKMIDKGI
ncbi:hypothetical protein A9Q81_22085 [Gammaproteobacteria bacterium 42_54_T18]|mgnify:CR=1 FL=1|nr:hypothetical protein A9Q81_22085 [Gammaproteobacteria bacterium 42_54_T18]